MITLTKIAKLANVSISTASKAFTMSTEVSEETRNIVFSIAKEHGVFKKFYNAKYPKLVVGVVCREYMSPTYPDLLKGIQRRLDEFGCDMCVASTILSSEKERALYDYYSMYTDVDALLTIGRSIPLPEDYPLPRVDISPWEVDENCPTLVMNYESISDAIEYFYSKGVKSVGFITCYKRSGKAWKFCKFMKAVFGGVDESLIEICEKKGGECGYLAALSMINKGRVPRAVFCETDEIALGAMKAFFEKGYAIPDDVAIVGWNNDRFGSFTTPTLSTIHIYQDEVVRESVEMLINKLSGKECKRYVEINSEFIKRESSEIK